VYHHGTNAKPAGKCANRLLPSNVTSALNSARYFFRFDMSNFLRFDDQQTTNRISRQRSNFMGETGETLNVIELWLMKFINGQISNAHRV
jgi:hypothetical protein